MATISKEELSMAIDSAWESGMNSDGMADWLLDTVFAQEWDPIETNPKNEDPFLAWFGGVNNPSYGYRAITHWDSIRNEFNGTEIDCKPIYWMPLPGSPKF